MRWRIQVRINTHNRHEKVPHCEENAWRHLTCQREIWQPEVCHVVKGCRIKGPDTSLMLEIWMLNKSTVSIHISDFPRRTVKLLLLETAITHRHRPSEHVGMKVSEVHFGKCKIPLIPSLSLMMQYIWVLLLHQTEQRPAIIYFGGHLQSTV